MKDDIRFLSFDLDGTLLGDREAIRRFRKVWNIIPGEVRPLLCYNTGRLFEDTLQIIEEEGLPLPDYCICGVGTLVYDFCKKKIESDFFTSLHAGWDSEIVFKIMSSFEGAVLQPLKYQNDFKSSWYLLDADDSQIDEIRVRMSLAELDVNIVYSSSRDLDILPRNATKGKALMWLLEKLNIRSEELIVGGDTGNDSSMFLLPGVKGIVVANAMPELLELKDRAGVYVSQGSFTDGILEGLAFFGVIMSDDGQEGVS